MYAYNTQASINVIIYIISNRVYVHEKQFKTSMFLRHFRLDTRLDYFKIKQFFNNLIIL